MKTAHTTDDSNELLIQQALKAGKLKEAVKHGADPERVLLVADARYDARWIGSSTRRWILRRIKK